MTAIKAAAYCYLADLTDEPTEKIDYLITATRQGSFGGLWRLAKLSPENKANIVSF
ncbi:hypothetical protein [Providencia sneebia]|uniref:hypothetical protein n=1 Tax=Providencia sneebia TaxID=516075 RepID=UPI0002D902D3|nr:hypothetical protein [Providencia sneebia]